MNDDAPPVPDDRGGYGPNGRVVETIPVIPHRAGWDEIWREHVQRNWRSRNVEPEKPRRPWSIRRIY